MTTNIYIGLTATNAADHCPTRNHWPEIMLNLPLHASEIVKICPVLVGQTFATMSEFVIFWFSKEIRQGRLDPATVFIHWCDFDGVKVLPFDAEGDLPDWPDPRGFFNERFDLLCC